MPSQQVYDGNNIQLARASNVFKSIKGTSGTLSLWTPSSGKKFRLLTYGIEITSNAADSTTEGELTLNFKDEGTEMKILHNIYIPKTAVTVGGAPLYLIPQINLGPLGYLSIAINNILKVELANIALSSGTVRLRASGTEE